MLDIICESVDATFGDKRYVIRVSEVEGKLFNPCRLDKVGDSKHIPDREVHGDSEEEKDWESDDRFSDEDQLKSSDDGLSFSDESDEDDEQYDLDDDADSVVRETVLEDAINASPTHAGEKTEVQAAVLEVQHARDIFDTPKKQERIIAGHDVEDAINASPTRAQEIIEKKDAVYEVQHARDILENPKK
ncbi:hypothetical protein L2E82_49722 [Cichorium intybus]|uniref:Uncharacterized protein n=1 Tax=Cichorium intybus TaxID=13427 RepID=A0ACB8Z107_CICIN|nr:hypothetical protein L2E82_49722 [Cichorium intybus]